MTILKSFRWIAWVAAFLMMFGSLSHAQRGWGPGPEYGSGNDAGKGKNRTTIERSHRMEAFLDLSDDQIQKVEEIRLELQKESLPTINKIGEKRAQLKTLISESGDIPKISLLIDEIGQLQISLQKQRVNHHMKIRELLTDDQKIKFDSHFGNQFASGGGHSRSFGMHGWDLK